MKFTIEVYATATDGSEAVPFRKTISAINPPRARTEAGRLLKTRKNARARVMNPQGEVIYQIERKQRRAIFRSHDQRLYGGLPVR